MFLIKIHLISLNIQNDFKEQLTLKIKKDHWHYSLMDKIKENKLDVFHEISILEKDGCEPSFDLILLGSPSAGKAVLYGSSTINIMEWPLESAKRQKIKMSSSIQLDIQLQVNYTFPQSKSSLSLSDFTQIQIEQRIKQTKGQNEFLNSKINELQSQKQELKSKSKKLQERHEFLMQQEQSQEMQFKKNLDKYVNENRNIDRTLEETNMKLARIINLILENGDFKIINAMNQLLEARDNK